MELKKLTDRIYYLPHNPETDRPMLTYLRGSRFSLAVDAGYSKNHVRDFYDALAARGFGTPDFTAITHWHYDHTFGMHALKSVTIAHENTNKFLREQRELARNPEYFHAMKQEDVHFRTEYEGLDKVTIVLSDMEFCDRMVLHLGGMTAILFHTESPHSDDSVCVYLPEEKVLFLGDATSEDFFHGGYMDKKKLNRLISMIEQTDCVYCMLSHWEPLKKEELLTYLDGIR